MVSAEDVVRIYQLFQRNHIPLWLSGGWGVDALLGEQTREHHDLDVIVLLEDIPRLGEFLAREGFNFKDVWSENRWVTSAGGGRMATAFVLQDAAGRELDVHAVYLDVSGNAIPAWAEAEGLIFTRDDLAGTGTIGGMAVACFSARMQMICHTGYELPQKQQRDLQRLHEKTGAALPPEVPHT